MTAVFSPAVAPSPRAQRPVGHLGRWGLEPLALLDEGAALGPVFRLRLWRNTIVGYSPAWNRFVLSDLDTFVSKGSMSGLSPHLNAGVVQADGVPHDRRRAELNPSFARKSVAGLQPRIGEVTRRLLPDGEFDAVAWSSMLLQAVLSSCFFDDQLPTSTLGAFLRPLDRPLPIPFLRRPILFRRMNRALATAVPAAPDWSLAAPFAGLEGGIDEVRVALSAAYDTTAHTLAWLLHHVARQPELLDPARHSDAIDEVLRLYPAGWLGSRRCARDTEFEGIAIPQGTLVMYSPYLTHRDPSLWAQPLEFRPQRFDDPLPAWGYLPFSAGRRTCLGSWFARLVLTTVLEVVAERSLTSLGGDPAPRAGITLAPSGPLPLRLGA